MADVWDNKFRDLTLSDMENVGTIGAGGYGRVELVTVNTMPKISFARKKVRKNLITLRGYQKLIYNEKQNMRLCSSLFICKSVELTYPMCSHFSHRTFGYNI